MQVSYAPRPPVAATTRASPARQVNVVHVSKSTEPRTPRVTTLGSPLEHGGGLVQSLSAGGELQHQHTAEATQEDENRLRLPGISTAPLSSRGKHRGSQSEESPPVLHLPRVSPRSTAASITAAPVETDHHHLKSHRAAERRGSTPESSSALRTPSPNVEREKDNVSPHEEFSLKHEGSSSVHRSKMAPGMSDASPIDEKNEQERRAKAKEKWGVFKKLETAAKELVASSSLSKRLQRPKLSYSIESVMRLSKKVRPASSNIQLAIDMAEPGDTIEIDKGVYNRTTLHVNKAIILRAADGMKGEVIIKGDAARGPVVTLNAFCLRLEGITIIGEGIGNPALQIIKGSPEIVDCDIFGYSGGISVINRADPYIYRTRIRDSQRAYGISFSPGSGILEDCEITGNRDAGIVIDHRESNPFVHNCYIHSGRACGIAVEQSGTGTFIGCTIQQNACPGVLVRSGGNPVLWKCNLTNGMGPGLLIENAKGIVECNSFQDNALHDIESSQGGQPVVRNNYLKNECGGGSSGIAVLNKGRGHYELNYLENYGTCAVVIRDRGTDAIFCRNTIKLGERDPSTSVAVMIQDSAQGELKDNTIIGWDIGSGHAPLKNSGGQPKLIRNVICASDSPSPTAPL